MKNPGCGKQPGFSSLRLREAILPNSATPERACGDDTQSKTAYGDDANPLSNRRALKFIHSYVSADIYPPGRQDLSLESVSYVFFNVD